MASSFIHNLLLNTFWAGLAKWISSLLGVFSTLILARLLLPEDFGLVATAAIITGFFEILSRLGTEQYIIKKQTLSSVDINTAWTIQLLAKLIIALLIAASSFFVPGFIGDPRLENILLVLTIVPIIIGLTNIELVLLKKELNFKQLTKIVTSSRVVSFVLTISIAYYYESYWAFIIGTLFYHFTTLFLSYYRCRSLPVFTLENVNQQFSFSKWTFLKGVVNYFGGKADSFIIAKFLGVTQLGAMNITGKINSLPSGLFVEPLTTVLFPAMSKSIGNKAEFSKRTQVMFFTLFAITCPLAVFIAINADLIATVALGDTNKWQLVPMLMFLLSPLVITGTLMGKLFDTLTLLGHVKLLFKFEIFTSVAAISIFSLLAYIGADIALFCYTKVAMSSLYCCILFVIAFKFFTINYRSFFIAIAVIIVSVLPYVFISGNIFVSSYSIVNLMFEAVIWILSYLILLVTFSSVIGRTSVELTYINDFSKKALNMFNK
jgi:O-antigen/teichoic acid export membrane protein